MLRGKFLIFLKPFPHSDCQDTLLAHPDQCENLRLCIALPPWTSILYVYNIYIYTHPICIYNVYGNLGAWLRNRRATLAGNRFLGLPWSYSLWLLLVRSCSHRVNDAQSCCGGQVSSEDQHHPCEAVNLWRLPARSRKFEKGTNGAPTKVQTTFDLQTYPWLAKVSPGSLKRILSAKKINTSREETHNSQFFDPVVVQQCSSAAVLIDFHVDLAGCATEVRSILYLQTSRVACLDVLSQEGSRWVQSSGSEGSVSNLWLTSSGGLRQMWGRKLSWRRSDLGGAGGDEDGYSGIQWVQYLHVFAESLSV